MTAVLLLLAVAVQTPTSYDTVFDQLKSLAPRADHMAPVRGLVLRRDVMELRLDSGFAYQLTTVQGRNIGIAFVGAGTLSFVPPLIVEQFNLKRVLGDSTINGPITAAVFIFADSTGDELGRQLAFGPGGGGARMGDAAGAVDDALDFIMDNRSHGVDLSLMTSLLNQTTTGYFSAYIKRQRGEAVTIQYDPLLAEEVLLMRRGKMMNQRVETICQFQRADDLVRGVSVADKHPEPLALAAHDIDATIDKNYKFSARVTARLVGRRDRQQWADFALYPELDVDSVTIGGQPVTYYRRDRQAGLWVRFPQPIGPGDSIAIRFVYHGNLIGFGSAMDEFLPPWWDPTRRELMPMLDAWAFMKDVTTWFPRYSDEGLRVTLTFHTPSDLRLATIGRMVDSSAEGNVITTRWVSELPTNQIAFNIGKFEQLSIRDPRIPPVTVHVNSEAHRAIRQVIPSARDPQEMVGADVANSLSFFTRVFGPPLFHQYTATEIPYFHGLAFPGMIQLSWWTFMGLSRKGSDEMFRAHEMAHQWWGIGVEPAGYRDAWLAEGFSEFAGMWYMQMILRDNDTYLKTLRDARQDIRRERGKAVPIGLGRRAAESWRGNYELQTYAKGAWVVHMLRNMMIDTRTMAEDRFMAMMKDFYAEYRGRRASTEDFQRTVEKHFGQPMNWFFDEWVYGTAVPTYTFAWYAEPDSTGFSAHVRVRQTDAPESFVMYVPILIKFERGEALIRMVVRGAKSEAVIHLPAKPTSMQLNALESVLAEVKSEDWGDR